jgi:hypothetical protein
MPQPPPATTQSTLRLMRIVHGALIMSIFLYVLVCWRVGASHPEPMDESFVMALGVLSLGIIAAGFYLRSKWIGAAYESLRAKPDDPASLALWRKGGIVSACFGESVVLYGVVIYLISGNTKQAAPFFVAGLLVMLMWWPKQP